MPVPGVRSCSPGVAHEGLLDQLDHSCGESLAMAIPKGWWVKFGFVKIATPKIPWDTHDNWSKLCFHSFSFWKWPFDHLEVAQFSNKSILRPRKQCSLLGGWAIQNICSSIYGSSLIPDRLENHTWNHQPANLEQLFSSKLSTTFQNYRNYRSHCTLKYLTHIHVSDCVGSSSPSRLHETSVKLAAKPGNGKSPCSEEIMYVNGECQVDY